jgi:hypothetical protein
MCLSIKNGAVEVGNSNFQSTHMTLCCHLLQRRRTLQVAPKIEVTMLIPSMQAHERN